eukprot:8841240-Ditylum_brightwellii.AAC.1
MSKAGKFVSKTCPFKKIWDIDYLVVGDVDADITPHARCTMKLYKACDHDRLIVANKTLMPQMLKVPNKKASCIISGKNLY